MNKKEKRCWDDLMWGESQHTEFLAKYRDQWVAVKNKKVVAFGDNLAKVKQSARQKTGEQEIPVVYVDCGEHIYGQN